MELTNEIIRYANHFAAVTEPLRGRSGAMRLCSRALKVSTSLSGGARALSSADGRERKKLLDAALAEFHKTEYLLDTLLSADLIPETEHARLTGEGTALRRSIIRAITAAREGRANET